MAFEEGTETLECKRCATVHNAKWSRQPVREEVAISCQTCGAPLYEGKTLRDYYDVSLA